MARKRAVHSLSPFPIRTNKPETGESSSAKLKEGMSGDLLLPAIFRSCSRYLIDHPGTAPLLTILTDILCNSDSLG